MEKNKDKMILLDLYTSALLIEKEMNKIDERVNQANIHNKKVLKRLIVLVGPLLMFLGGVSNIMPMFVLGGIITIGGVSIMAISDLAKELKFCSSSLTMSDNPEEFKKMLEEEEKILEEKLAETIARRGKLSKIDETADKLESLSAKKRDRISEKDFYTDTAKLVMSTPISEDEKRYYKMLNNQRQAEVYNSPIEESMVKISRELYDYSKIYNLPPVAIDTKQWESLFKNVYNIFESKGLGSKYYDYMAELSRITYARALVYEKDIINLESFLNELYECDSISKRDIQSILKSIKEEAQVKVLHLDAFRK